MLGADVPAYNIPGVTAQLNFTPEALAGIFLGKITKWNDPAIAKANPGVKLPASDIVVVHRSDGSGTTYVWIDYLSQGQPGMGDKGRPRHFGELAGRSWRKRERGRGRTGEADAEFDRLRGADLRGSEQDALRQGEECGGEFVQANLASVTAAAASAAKEMPDDFRVSITNAPGKDAYPISTFTWLLIPEKIADPAKKKAIKDFLKWMLTDGQNDDGGAGLRAACRSQSWTKK